MAMTEQAKTIKYLKNYQEPEFKVLSLDLQFELHETETIVTATMQLKQLKHNATLKLNGEKLKLLSVQLNNKELSDNEYTVDAEFLTIENTPEEFILTTKVQNNPEANTALTGLYLSSDNFCTQCEAEGFRRITYFFDRPDHLTKFTTKIIADKTKYPILLSNGNPIERGELTSNKHFVTWEDPFDKPCYLFALVAGKLDFIEDSFITMSGREIKLQIYVENGNKNKANYAMDALKDSMRWDEKTYSREYDLDIFMIVAVSDFNMGAMENKGLNIFNSKYILASEETATDDDYEFIAAVIAHEYFHNWSGDRVTCRDWFQLSLKEGFTVFRDQSYTADTTSAAVKRIRDARTLRTYQYAEDAGPMSHPVQPDSYMEIDNFYTHTVYEKGAEVIRMMKTIIGSDAFFKGANLYFANNDGKAVTINEFTAAMEEASGKDLTHFKLWYKQSGTPVISVDTRYDPVAQTFTLKTKQTVPDTADMKNKKPMHIPLAMALYDSEGQKFKSKLLELTEEHNEFVLVDIDSEPTLSLLNDFTAPVEVIYDYREEDLAFLMQHDQNSFSRWEAGQVYIKRLFVKARMELPQDYLKALRACLLDKKQDKSFLAELLLLPSEKYLLGLSKPINIMEQHRLYKAYESQIANALYDDFLTVYNENLSAVSMSNEDRAARKLKNICLHYLMATETEEALGLAYKQYQTAENMTDRMAAFKAILNTENVQKAKVISDFYVRFKADSLVLDKWFSAQAAVDLSDTLDKVRELMQHEAFTIKNPNKVRALVGAFAMTNLGQFHRIDGQGYELLTDVILELNKLNPQIAARLLEPLTHWKDYVEPNASLMQQQLLRIKSEPKLSPDVFEIVEKSL